MASNSGTSVAAIGMSIMIGMSNPSRRGSINDRRAAAVDQEPGHPWPAQGRSIARAERLFAERLSLWGPGLLCLLHRSCLGAVEWIAVMVACSSVYLNAAAPLGAAPTRLAVRGSQGWLPCVTGSSERWTSPQSEMTRGS